MTILNGKKRGFTTRPIAAHSFIQMREIISNARYFRMLRFEGVSDPCGFGCLQISFFLSYLHEAIDEFQ